MMTTLEQYDKSLNFIEKAMYWPNKGPKYPV